MINSSQGCSVNNLTLEHHLLFEHKHTMCHDSHDSTKKKKKLSDQI